MLTIAANVPAEFEIPVHTDVTISDYQPTISRRKIEYNPSKPGKGERTYHGEIRRTQELYPDQIKQEIRLELSAPLYGDN